MRIPVTFACLCLAVAPGFAQQDPDMAKLAQLSKPGDMHKVVDKMAGDWKVEITFRLGSGPEMKGTAECHAEWLYDGRFLRKTYKASGSSQPFAVEQTVGYDNFRKEFFEFQIESDNTARLDTAGQLTEDGKTLNCVGTTTDPVTLKICTMRTVTVFVDADTYVVEWWMKLPDKSATKQVTLVHTRKK